MKIKLNNLQLYKCEDCNINDATHQLLMVDDTIDYLCDCCFKLRPPVVIPAE